MNGNCSQRRLLADGVSMESTELYYGSIVMKDAKENVSRKNLYKILV